MKIRLSCAVSLSIVSFAWVSQAFWSEERPPANANPQKATEKTSSPKAESVIGRRVPNFVVPDSTGKPVALADFNEARLVVFIFLGTKCPIGNAYIPDLVDLQNRYQDRKVRFIGIHSCLSESIDAIARHAKEFKIEFPVLVDNNQLVADLVGAQRISEAFVLDRRRNIRYRGRIDDRVGYGVRREKARRSDLEEAINELLAGKAVSVANTEVQGCLITRRASLKDAEEVTYARQVAPIVQNRCGDCHHPGTAAPFSLLTYEEVREWSGMIKEVVVQRRMPPWSADPRYGHFSNDLRLSQREVDTLVEWVDSGAPLGDKNDLPTPREYPQGWLISQPDIVFRMPTEFTIKSTGTVKYQYFVTPTNFTEDVWVQATEARPGNRAAVHHIIVFVREKGSQETQNLPYVAGYAPGEEPSIHPEETGFRIPAGAELVWQVHYTPTGKEERDCSEVGFIRCKQRPKRPVLGGLAIDQAFRIPPGEENHRVVAVSNVSRDIELLMLMPHMHLRGKSFRYTALYPDGRKEILLNIPDFDFNWQHQYRLTRPILLPKGTTIECVAHFDNSADNPANPDPTVTVGWGDQTWEEMMIGWYSYVDAFSGETRAKEAKSPPE